MQPKPDDIENPPIVVCFSGLDPTGGAGIQADIEAITSMGAVAAPIVTALTVQDTHTVYHFQPVAIDLLRSQADCLLNDMPVAAFKLGMLASQEVVEFLVELLQRHPDVPVIYDPVLAAGGGTSLCSGAMIEAVREKLLPLVTLCTPNTVEAKLLGNGSRDPERAAREMLEQGCGAVLLTGTHMATPAVHNTLFLPNQEPQVFSWERLPHIYHGSGCTLASAIAGLLANDLDLETACDEAQQYTHNALRYGFALGKSQWHPDRFYWSREPEDSHDH